NNGAARGPVFSRYHNYSRYARARHRRACAAHRSFAGRYYRKRRSWSDAGDGIDGGKLRETVKRFLYELSESWKIAVAQMRSNMTRSTLTALGVIIGIVAVTLMGTAIGGI